MLRYSLAFFIISLIAAALGFGGIADASVGIAKFFFFVFISLAVITLIIGALAINKISKK